MTTIKDFYIGENDGSGIQAKSKEEFFEYLEEKFRKRKKLEKPLLILLSNREITWKKSLMIFWKQQTTTT